MGHCYKADKSASYYKYMWKISVFLILALLPFPSLAHEGEIHFNVNPGTLPGEMGYVFERVAEWVSVNLLTVSTKAKQEKKLALADERLAEIIQLIALNKTDELGLPARRYQTFLTESEDMAEKIIFLDGAYIGLGYGFESRSRQHEMVLLDLLKDLPKHQRGEVIELISLTRIENEDMFRYIAGNYQRTDADIEKNKQVFGYHIDLVEKELFGGKINPEKARQISKLLLESRKHQGAGLTLEGYEYLKKAKSILYGQILQK